MTAELAGASPSASMPLAKGLGAVVPHLSRVLGVHEYLALLCRSQACTFTLNGEMLSPELVMSPSGFLPVLAWDVQELGRDLYGNDFGCCLKVDSQAMFGARAQVPHFTAHLADVTRTLFFQDAATTLFGLRPNASIEVASLVEMLRDNFQGLIEGLANDEGEIPWPLPSRLN